MNESNFLVCLTVKKGDRVAQLVCEKICYPELVEEKVKKKNNNHLNCPKNLIWIKLFIFFLQTLDETERGAGGFGSTGQ